MAPVIDLKKNDVYSDLHFNMLTGRVSSTLFYKTYKTKL